MISTKKLSINTNTRLLDREAFLKREFCHILEQEETLWAIKSRTKWIPNGDKNTKYYHVATLIKGNMAKIRMIKDF